MDSRATLWTDNQIVDLNTLLSDADRRAGWVLTEAHGINDNGWIVGQAANFKTNTGRGFLLSPIPEPETYMLFLIGLAVIGCVAKRRKG